MNNKTSDTMDITYALKHDYYIPSEILNLPNIYGSEIEREANIIRDGFESRTNGMFDREREDLLETITPESPLHPWKILIQAVTSLYRGETEALAMYLAEIPRDCGPGLLVNTLTALGELPGGKEKRSSFSRPEKNLYNLVSEDRRFVKSMIMQLKDSLEAGEDYFFEFALMTIREIREMNEKAGYRLALWCLNTIYLEDLDYTLFLDSLKTLFPPALVMRFSAMVLTGEDLEEGIKCWLLSLIFRLREGGMERPEAAEYLLIIAGLLDLPGDNDTPITDGNDIEQILTLLHSELSAFFRTELSPLTKEKPVSHFPEVWAITLDPKVRLEFPPAEEMKTTAKRRNDNIQLPLQLELFGEVSPETEPEPEPENNISSEENEQWDFSTEITKSGLLSPRPLESPGELRTILRSRPRYVGPEPWLEVIIRKRRNLI